MAYSKKFSPIGGQSTRGASPQMFSYLSGTDTSEEIQADGYFNLARTYLEKNDLIVAVDNSGVTVFYRVSLVPINGDVKIINIDGGGSVTSLSVASDNGFAGTVTSPTTTPEITLTTTVDGIIRGSGGIMSSTLIDESDLNFSDIITNNTTTLKHGLAPKLSGNSNQFFDGNGNFSTPSGTVNSYTAVTFTAQTSIVVNHNFGAFPAINTLDSTGNIIVANNIQHTSINSFTITFTQAESGTIIATVGSPQASNFRTVTGDSTTTVNDKIVKCTGSGSIITLHSAASLEAQELNIDNASDTNIFLIPSGSETIEDEATQTIPPESKPQLYSDGVNWRFI
jgi:hypothetical protein